MSGYIHAIRKGAKLIYVDSEDVNLADHEGYFSNHSSGGGGLIYYERKFGVSGGFFDPYTFFEGHFMQSQNETLSLGQFNRSINLLLCRKLPAAGVQEGLIIEKGRIVAPLTIATGTYSLWIPKHTLYYYNTLFMLPILNVVRPRKETFILSLLAQKLLHLVGTSLAFYPIESESSSGFGVAKDYRDKGYLAEDWVSLISYWIEELNKISYRFPPIHEQDFDCLYALDETSRRQNCRRSSIYFPNFSAANMSKVNKWRKESLDDLSKWCAKAEYCGTAYNGSTKGDFSRVYETTLKTRLSNVSLIMFLEILQNCDLEDVF
ncbi:unnamed protein product [Cylicocyclus nassatus]|uniref:Uncharacterized protein n=1 Tax=Cylicocyclus nassatus TaxID=53992 RepID=A0AA36HAD2_CYLNA|nr:unnamed protein product [Cylicocyclus nassatus]